MTKLVLPRNMKRESKDNLPQDDLASIRAKELQSTQGEILARPGSTYLGSATVHYYVRNVMGNEHTYETIQQVSINKVPEGFADYGHKELQKSMMAAYGRKEKATR